MPQPSMAVSATSRMTPRRPPYGADLWLTRDQSPDRQPPPPVGTWPPLLCGQSDRRSASEGQKDPGPLPPLWVRSQRVEIGSPV
jgi:hypothetical protein